MYANLNEVKERLEKEGIVNDIKYYNNDSELAINEDYFIWLFNIYLSYIRLFYHVITKHYIFYKI